MIKNLINKAISFASDSHAGQLDKGGVPYIFHCLYVMNSVVKKHGHHDQELAAIAVLHDVVEGTRATVDQIAVMFGERVAAGVEALTKRKGESFDGYLTRVKSNPDAIKVKIEDLKHNLHLERLPRYPDLSEKDNERIDKYNFMLFHLLREKNHA